MDRTMPPFPPSSPLARRAMAETRTPTPNKTPRKRLSSAKKTSTSDSDSDTIAVKKARNGTKADGSTPRKRKTPAKEILTAQPMGRTFDLCTPQDQMLITWKESGRTWEEIRNKWFEMTGDRTAVSTLPNRYARLKNHFTIVNDEHNPILLETKQEVEAKFEREKWEVIAGLMKTKGAGEYEGKEVERQYKKLLEFGEELRLLKEEEEAAVVDQLARRGRNGGGSGSGRPTRQKGKKVVRHEESEGEGEGEESD